MPSPARVSSSPHAASSQQSKRSKNPDEERKRKEPPLLENRGDPDQQAGQRGKPFRFGVEVNLVVLATTVVDKDGNFVGGLKQEDFTVYEDRVSQTIAYFGQVDIPISLGLVIDISGSMRPRIALVNQAALTFLKLSNPKDETFLVAFNDEVSLIEDFTDDPDTIRDSLENLTVHGGTALYDAIRLSTEKAKTGSRQKHVLLVITDGEDRDSYYKLEEVLQIIQESDVQVFVVGLLTAEPDEGIFDVFKKNPQEKAREALTRIALETGAKAFFPKEVSELPAIAKNIAHELRNQYHIGYLPTNTAKDGAWRTVQVALPGAVYKLYRVRTRSGYFAPKPPSPD